MEINKIKEITKIGADKKLTRLQKFIEKKELREAKKAERLIVRLNALILKRAKKGEDILRYDSKIILTNDQWLVISKYFSNKGYFVWTELGLIMISWTEKPREIERIKNKIRSLYYE